MNPESRCFHKGHARSCHSNFSEGTSAHRWWAFRCPPGQGAFRGPGCIPDLTAESLQVHHFAVWALHHCCSNCSIRSFSLITLRSQIKPWWVYCFFLARTNCHKSELYWSPMAEMPGAHSCAALGNTLTISITVFALLLPQRLEIQGSLQYMCFLPRIWAVFYKNQGHHADCHLELGKIVIPRNINDF